MANTWDLTLEADEEADEVELLTDAVIERIEKLEGPFADEMGRAAERDLGDNGAEVTAALRYEAGRLHIILMRLRLLQD